MGNVLPSDIRLHRRYDLKGSTYKRTVGAEVAASNPEAVLKDLDVDMKVGEGGRPSRAGSTLSFWQAPLDAGVWALVHQAGQGSV